MASPSFCATLKNKSLTYPHEPRQLMEKHLMKRRTFLRDSALMAAGAALVGHLKAADAQAEAARSSGGAIMVDPKPLFEISPHLYMQFMEQVGVTDSSVEASWDWNRDDW